MDRIGARRLSALVSGLPSDAAVWRDGKHWTTQDELAAVALERADMWGHLLARPHYKNPDRLPAPVMFTHPDRVNTKPKKRAPRNSQELAMALGIGKG